MSNPNAVTILGAVCITIMRRRKARLKRAQFFRLISYFSGRDSNICKIFTGGILIKNLLVLFGGQSSEHSVSCKSAASIIARLDRKLFNVVTVGITKKGEWFLTTATPEQVANGEWEMLPDNLPVFLTPNRAFAPLQVVRKGEMIGVPIDCAFPIMHGELCEDGAIQGLFELCGLPYVGPDISASACCMDKSVTKLVAASSGIPQASYCVVNAEEVQADSQATAQKIEEKFAERYPLFVKPASAGSSVGVSKAHNRAELIVGLRLAGDVCRKILVEETIIGREVEVAVLGNRDPQASVVGEVLAANEFYDFDAKYENSASRTEIPAQISEEAAAKLRSAAIAIYNAMGCSGLSRVDFFLLPNDEIVFNEINTIPGFTNISMYPKMWEASGIPYQQLLTRLYELAVEHGCGNPRVH